MVPSKAKEPRRRGRPTKEIVLSNDERRELESWARRRKTAQALALRARIILRVAEGATNREVAAQLDVHPVTVGKWRERFAVERVGGLLDEPRPGVPRSIGDDRVEAVIVKTLEERPPDATHWSTRSMAEATGMSQSAISRIWRAFGLQPHRVESFKLGAVKRSAQQVSRSLFPEPHVKLLVVSLSKLNGTDTFKRVRV